ncbi:hypothetical protein [Celerinatantimonas sp. MCCC 1A17872]|uniref:hypothetical protein n=1 Tax=Celerinatantimonas sp. MCCC 1A17872 TaxID=3177514 RepID=UPI0038CB234F
MAIQSTREELLEVIRSNKRISIWKNSYRLEIDKNVDIPKGLSASYKTKSLSHKPYRQSLIMSEGDKNFWFNIVVGCSGPLLNKSKTKKDHISKKYAQLDSALSDAIKLHELINAYPVISPEIIFPKGVRCAPGSFAETVILKEPTKATLVSAINKFSAFIDKNKYDPEWMGGQLNFIFSGHGLDPEDRKKSNMSGLLLKDGVLTAKEFYDLVSDAVPKDAESDVILNNHGKCRLDVFLDCCYSGLFTSNIFGFFLDNPKNVIPGKLWASSMPFQQSYEQNSSGLFTRAYLSDESRKLNLSDLFSSEKLSLADGGVGVETKHNQNPFIIDFSMLNFSMTIPGAVGTTRIMNEYSPIEEKTFTNSVNFLAWITCYLRNINKSLKGAL